MRRMPQRLRLVVALSAFGLSLSITYAQDPTAPPGAAVREQMRQVTPARGVAREMPTGTAILRGTVVAADNGSPIRRAQVRITGQGVPPRLASTDAQGRFELRELPAGRYTLTASKGGFVTLQYGQRRPSESGTPLEIRDAQVVEKLVIGLPRGSVIGGRITDEFGEPVANAVVSAMRYGYSGGSRRLLPSPGGNSRDTTDDQGQFRLFGLAPGEYVISAMLRIGGPEAADPTGESTGYPPTYYPGTSNLAEAQRVPIAVSQEQQGITFALIATRLVRVTGAVINSHGAPVTEGMIMLAPANTRLGPGSNLQSSRLDGTGQFRLANVAPGRYTAQVRTNRGRNTGDLEFGRQDITVGGDDLHGVVVVTAPGARVTGQIVTDTGAPTGLRPQQVQVAARLTQADQTLPGPGGNGRVNEDWTFEVSGLFDARLFRVNTPQGWTLKSVTLNGQDITDVPMDFPAGQSFGGLEVTITNRVTEITGRVTDTRGTAITDATIVVFPADDSRWTYLSRFIRTARPDQDGLFQVRGLPALDRYFAIAVQGLEDGQANDPDYLATIREKAVSFSLNEGETRALDLRFNPR